MTGRSSPLAQRPVLRRALAGAAPHPSATSAAQSAVAPLPGRGAVAALWTRRRLAAVAAVVLGLGGASALGYPLTQQQDAPQLPRHVGSLRVDAAAPPPPLPAPRDGARAPRLATARVPAEQPRPDRPLPAAQPTALTIPAIGVAFPVNSVGLNPDNTMQVPEPGPLYDQPA